MKSTLKNIFKLINTFDIIALIFLIAAIILTVYFDNIPFKAIAICAALAALIALANSVLQKISYRIPTSRFTIKTSGDLVTTTVRDAKAKHTTVDNFNNSEKMNSDVGFVFGGEDDGFVIVNRSTSTSKAEPSNTQKPKREYTDYGVDSVTTVPLNVNLTNTKNTKTVSINEDNKDIEKNKVTPDSDYITENNPKPTDQTETLYQEKINSLQTKTNETETDDLQPNIVDEPIVQNLESEFLEEKIPDIENDNTISSSNISNATFDDTKIDNINSKDNVNDINNSDFPISLIADLDKNSGDLREELDYLISYFLLIIRSVLEANTVAFVWVNYENKTLLFDSYLSDNSVKDFIIKNKKISIGNDIVSQIAANAKPQILSRINPAAELDLIPYYTDPIGTSSFVGTPIIFDSNVVGILCADTNKRDTYDISTVGFLGYFTKIISALLGSYSVNYDNENANNTLKALNRFTDIVSDKGCTVKQIFIAVIDFITELYDCTSVGICSYNDEQRTWGVIAYKSVEEINENFLKSALSLENSLVGLSLTRCQIISLSKVSSEHIRTNEFEPELGKGAFISVPIKSTTDTYGALFIEAKNNNSLTANVNFEILEAVCNQTGELLEKLQLVTLFNNYVAIDARTGIFTEKAFRKRLEEEVLRANDTNLQITLALIALDKYSSFEEEAKKKLKIFDHIINVTNNYLKPFDIVGKVNSDVIGIILINRDANQSKLLLERIRQQFATQFFDVETEKLLITISVGIATTRINDTFETFTSNATMALHQAQKRSNCVQVFE